MFAIDVIFTLLTLSLVPYYDGIPAYNPWIVVGISQLPFITWLFIVYDFSNKSQKKTQDNTPKAEDLDPIIESPSIHQSIKPIEVEKGPFCGIINVADGLPESVRIVYNKALYRPTIKQTENGYIIDFGNGLLTVSNEGGFDFRNGRNLSIFAESDISCIRIG